MNPKRPIWQYGTADWKNLGNEVLKHTPGTEDFKAWGAEIGELTSNSVDRWRNRGSEYERAGEGISQDDALFSMAYEAAKARMPLANPDKMPDWLVKSYEDSWVKTATWMLGKSLMGEKPLGPEAVGYPDSKEIGRREHILEILNEGGRIEDGRQTRRGLELLSNIREVVRREVGVDLPKGELEQQQILSPLEETASALTSQYKEELLEAEALPDGPDKVRAEKAASQTFKRLESLNDILLCLGMSGAGPLDKVPVMITLFEEKIAAKGIAEIVNEEFTRVAGDENLSALKLLEQSFGKLVNLKVLQGGRYRDPTDSERVCRAKDYTELIHWWEELGQNQSIFADELAHPLFTNYKDAARLHFVDRAPSSVLSDADNSLGDGAVLRSSPLYERVRQRVGMLAEEYVSRARWQAEANFDQDKIISLGENEGRKDKLEEFVKGQKEFDEARKKATKKWLPLGLSRWGVKYLDSRLGVWGEATEGSQPDDNRASDLESIEQKIRREMEGLSEIKLGLYARFDRDKRTSSEIAQKVPGGADNVIWYDFFFDGKRVQEIKARQVEELLSSDYKNSTSYKDTLAEIEQVMRDRITADNVTGLSADGVQGVAKNIMEEVINRIRLTEQYQSLRVGDSEGVIETSEAMTKGNLDSYARDAAEILAGMQIGASSYRIENGKIMGPDSTQLLAGFTVVGESSARVKQMLAIWRNLLISLDARNRNHAEVLKRKPGIIDARVVLGAVVATYDSSKPISKSLMGQDRGVHRAAGEEYLGEILIDISRSTPGTLTHELGHQLGMISDYVAAKLGRKSASRRGAPETIFGQAAREMESGEAFKTDASYYAAVNEKPFDPEKDPTRIRLEQAYLDETYASLVDPLKWASWLNIKSSVYTTLAEGKHWEIIGDDPETEVAARSLVAHLQVVKAAEALWRDRGVSDETVQESFGKIWSLVETALTIRQAKRLVEDGWKNLQKTNSEFVMTDPDFAAQLRTLWSEYKGGVASLEMIVDGTWSDSIPNRPQNQNNTRAGRNQNRGGQRNNGKRGGRP